MGLEVVDVAHAFGNRVALDGVGFRVDPGLLTGLPHVAGVDIALGMVWFVLGFALYSCAFAATAALVDKVTEAASAILQVSTALLVGYLLAVLVVPPNPRGAGSVFLSLFPLSAPMAMPVRWASSDVPGYQLLLAMLLTAGAAVLLVVVAASVYRRALLITGRRTRLREVLGPRRYI